VVGMAGGWLSGSGVVVAVRPGQGGVSVARRAVEEEQG
jgi:hypothetical protein